jgi:hypothetical protein
MRNASWDSFADPIIIALIALAILVGTGFAMCKVMGLEIKALGRFIGYISIIALSFLLVASILSRFF